MNYWRFNFIKTWVNCHLRRSSGGTLLVLVGQMVVASVLMDLGFKVPIIIFFAPQTEAGRTLDPVVFMLLAVPPYFLKYFS